MQVTMLVACSCLFVGCAALRTTRYPAFDEYRVIRQGEPLAIKASTRNEIVDATVGSAMIQGVPLVLQLENGVDWRQLADQVSIRSRGDIGNFGRYHHHILGTAVVATWTAGPEALRYLFPRSEQLRVARADGYWSRDLAAGWEPKDVFDLPELDPQRDEFLVPGVEAIGTDAGVRIPDERSLRPGGELEYWSPLDETDVVVDLAPGALLRFPRGFGGGAFPLPRNNAFVQIPRVDSIKILGVWYRTANRALWRMRSHVALDSGDTSVTILPLGKYVEGATVQTLDDDLEKREEEFLSALQSRDARTAMVMVTCWDSQAPHRPCLDVSKNYEFAAWAAPARTSAREVQYPFRVRRQNRLLGFVVGVGAILGFVALSTY